MEDAVKRNYIRNTSTDVKNHPRLQLAMMMTQGVTATIQASEAAGQNQLINSEVLPTACSAETLGILQKAGVKFGKKVHGDEIFTEVTLPAGWKKKPTSHTMHSDLVDNKGRVRASIFYKAAFYDRKADISARCRYRVDHVYNTDSEGKEVIRFHILDGIQIIHNVGVCDRSDYDLRDKFEIEANKWLDTNFPDWKNPGAYWD